MTTPLTDDQVWGEANPGRVCATCDWFVVSIDDDNSGFCAAADDLPHVDAMDAACSRYECTP